MNIIEEESAGLEINAKTNTLLETEQKESCRKKKKQESTRNNQKYQYVGTTLKEIVGMETNANISMVEVQRDANLERGAETKTTANTNTSKKKQIDTELKTNAQKGTASSAMKKDQRIGKKGQEKKEARQQQIKCIFYCRMWPKRWRRYRR